MALIYETNTHYFARSQNKLIEACIFVVWYYIYDYMLIYATFKKISAYSKVLVEWILKIH
jgi:hypothetical protein